MMRRAMMSLLLLATLLASATACDLLRPGGKQRIARSDGNLAKIKAGWFVFGGKPLCRDDASACQTWLDRNNKTKTERLFPWRLVYLTSYSIEKREVTNAEYLECVQAGHCSYPGEEVTTGNAGACYLQVPLVGEMAAGLAAPLCRFTRDEVALEPIRSVTWKQAREYCRWRYEGTDYVNADLPTEAMWERAAVGPAVDGQPFVQPELPGAIASADKTSCASLINGVAGTSCTKDPNVDSSAVYSDTAHPFAVAQKDGTLFRGEFGTTEGVADLAGNVAEWVMDASDDIEGNYDCKDTAPQPPQASVPIQDMLGADYAVEADCECIAHAGYTDCTNPGAHRAGTTSSVSSAADYCNPWVGQNFASAMQDADENVEHIYKGGSYASKNWCDLSPRARLSSTDPAEHIGFRCAVRTKAQTDEAGLCAGQAAASMPRATGPVCQPAVPDAGVDASGAADASATDSGADS